MKAIFCLSIMRDDSTNQGFTTDKIIKIVVPSTRGSGMSKKKNIKDDVQ
jgi:hypothetical protein